MSNRFPTIEELLENVVPAEYLAYMARVLKSGLMPHIERLRDHPHQQGNPTSRDSLIHHVLNMEALATLRRDGRMSAAEAEKHDEVLKEFERIAPAVRAVGVRIPPLVVEQMQSKP